MALALVLACSASESRAADGTVDTEKLIADLSSNEFAVRQRATSELQLVGPEALPYLLRAIRSTDPEASSRAWKVVQTLAMSSNPAVGEAMRGWLQQLENEPNHDGTSGIQTGVSRIREAIAERARVDLTHLGATVMAPAGGAALGYNVQIGQGWRGGDEKLALLAELRSIPWLSIENSSVTDAALVHVAKLGQSTVPLTKLYLGSSGLTGADLQVLAPLSSVQHLSLKYLPLDDARLAKLPNFPSLQYLMLDGTQVGDQGLQHLTQYQRLQILWLEKTRITDAGLVHLAKLPNLDALYLTGTDTGGLGLAALRDAPKLKSISLKGVKFAPKALQALGQIEHLESLALDMSSVTDEQLADLAGLKELRILGLSNTTISDDGMEHLGQLKALQIVHLSNTLVTREGAAELERALPRCRITLEQSGRLINPVRPNPMPPQVQPVAPPRQTAP